MGKKTRHPGQGYFKKLKGIAENGRPSPVQEALPLEKEKPKMRWRQVDEYHIESDRGFKISRVGGTYTCWAPPGYRVRGVALHTGFIGFHYCEDGEEAKQACQDLLANPENPISAARDGSEPLDRGALEPAR